MIIIEWDCVATFKETYANVLKINSKNLFLTIIEVREKF